ncbi:MAG: hypothetical protein GWM91_21450 [Actinobacteria bacterium]|nr:hypothetical protein [Actinomycetota bacterium]NIW31541.1 hypothetical protein [Actinomycetota bacterium]NIX52808.1 hypothetical protein [Actinomycetota bacterium]
MPDAASGPGVTDPFGIGSAVGRLSGGARTKGHAAFMVLACALEPGEGAQLVVQCRYNGAAGAVALTDRRLLVVNAREWEPDVTTVDLEPGLTVKGWQDGNHAALVFEREDDEVVVDRIADSAVAQEIAAAVRGRSGG